MTARGGAGRPFLLWLATGALATAGCLLGAEDSSAKKADRVALPDAVEKALADLTTQAGAIKLEMRREDMKKTIAEIVEVTKLGEDGRKRLEAEARGPVERSITPWKEEFDKRLRPYLSNEGEGALTMLSQWPAEQLVRSGFPGDFGRPEDDPEWKAALQRILTPDQFKALDSVAGERERKVEREIAEYLKPYVEQARKARLAELVTEIEDMKAMLSLPEDKVKALGGKAEAAAGRAGDAMQLRAAKALRAMPEQQRMAMMANARNAFAENGEDDSAGDGAESSDALWSKAVTEILSGDERRRWEASANERSDRAARAMAMIFIAEMDKRVQFSSEQRARLEPLATRAFADKAKNAARSEVVNLTSAGLFKEAEVKPVLDATQWDRWQAAARGEYFGRYGNRRTKPADVKEAAKTDDKQELPDDERLLAAYLEKHTASRRADMAAVMAAKVEDVRRVVSLPEERVAHLRLAAKGAVEHALDNWRLQFDSWVRNSMNGMKGATLRQRLEGLEGGSISFGEEVAPSEHAFWGEALAEALTPEQKKRWDDQVAARKEYARRAITWGILAEMNRRYHLTNAQFAKLEPLVLGSVGEYFDDFTNMFGRGSSGVMPRYMIVLFAGVPEDAAKAVLTQAQWQQWKENDFKQISNWWESMKNNRRWRNNRRE